VVDGVDLIDLNNTLPGIVFGSITYPGAQDALKGVETATVANTVTNFDTIAYTDPTGTDITITNATTQEDPKTVTCLNGGNYNVATDNFQISANRTANDGTTVAATVVQVADLAVVVDITVPAARLRSGGENGTSAQDYTVTVTANQELLVAPTLDPDSAGATGTFQGVFTGGPLVWTASLRVDEGVPDLKGAFDFENLVATNLADTDTTAINSGSAYVLGGFVSRDLTFSTPFGPNTTLNTEVVDFSKVVATAFTTPPATTPLRQAIGTAPPVVVGYTVDAVSINPTTVIWLDTASSNTNGTGTAQIFGLEETV
jgi:hypothetical protein